MRYLNSLSRCLIVFTLASSLSACGFHLRGSTPLPEGLQNIYLDARNGPFKDQMEEVLVKTGAKIMPQREGADVQLSIIQSIVERTVGTLDERGKANSYRLQYKLQYSLLGDDGIVLRKTLVRENRRYDFDPDTVLDTESEEEELIEDMEESVALRVIRQLATVTVPLATGATSPGSIAPQAKQPAGAQ